jgi:diguanylate cyclase (GGDEF)-like protein
LPTLAFLFRTRQASEAQGKAEFLAHYDPLTGVLNRAAVAERLEVALRQSRLDRSAVTAVLFDVDAFKSINEAHGAGAGDAFLKHVAQTLQTPLNADEHCGRQGGDEFVVVLKRRNAVEIAAYVEAVMRAVHRPINVEDQSISGHVSAGVYPVEQGVSPADVLHRADVALYQAKSDGRNTWRLFSPEMEAAMAARRALEQRLREATTGNGFEVFFQPLLKVETEQCAGFEALLRLPDGEGGYIPPAIFIPVAETMGLINEIGAWVLQEATRVAATWPAEFFVAVNLSVRQFGDGKLVEEVRHALAQSGLRAQQLELEVTESMLIDNTEMVGAQLAALKALGVSIAMDDFGTGYSSLGYLWQFGFDKLKIDRSFVAALETDDARARDILDTIISLGHKLEMTVTAEGIETPHQAEVLSQLSADHFQGYLYGRPAPATELAAYLLRSRALGSKSEPAPANRAVI